MIAVSADAYRSTLAEYQRSAAALLDTATDAEQSVRAGVKHLLAWIESDPFRARLLCINSRTRLTRDTGG